MPKRKAIALFSGGLDSTLASKLVIDQGIDVVACNINTGFGATRDRQEHMQRMCDQVGAELMIVDIQSEYLQTVLFDPKYGYGKHFNPCIDCHAKMFEVAKRVMEGVGASLLISGEVLGQRPMSQNGEALQTVLDEANVDVLLLRPLSAKRLKPTIPEIEGWVDREKLEGIQGRRRERQLAMAAAYGWEDYESPGGGCLLTEPSYAAKIRDFVAHEEFGVEDIDLLKYGRHFRLPDGAKLVVGRHKEDNEALLKIVNPDYIPLRLLVTGPYSLLHREASEADKALAARIALTYGKSEPGKRYEVKVGDETIEADPFASKAEAQKYFVLRP